MKTIFFVRHGETDWNLELRIQGQKDVELNATGRLEASLTGRELAERVAGKRVRLVSSDSRRAHETAEIVARELEKTVASEMEGPETTPLLRERSSGSHEGRLWTEMAQELMQVNLYDGMPEPKFIHVLDHYTATDKTGEDRAQFIQRIDECCKFLRQEFERPSDHEVFVITSHGLTLRCIIASLFFHQGSLDYAWPLMEVKNGSYSEARVSEDGRLSLVSVNNSAHLPSKHVPDRYAMIKEKKK